MAAAGHRPPATFAGQPGETYRFFSVALDNVGNLEPDPDEADAVVTVLDTDGDGVPDGADNCPTVPDAGQADGDRDGVGDACDNCPQTANPDQADGNANGVGDACEIQVVRCDVDGDGDIDKSDLNLISRSRNKPASGPDDPRDANGDGLITPADVSLCIGRCTRPNCAVQ